MSRQATLNAVQGGITRLRDKGGASPNTLFELTNGHVTIARTIESRPGTVRHAELPDESRGLGVHEGQLTTYCHRMVPVPAGYRLEVIGHPTQADLPLRTIHFDGPAMGFPYVVAEYANGDVFHFWLERFVPWSANKPVIPGQTVSPTTQTGYLYQAGRTDTPAPAWSAGAARAVGDVVEPSTPNGYRYRVVEVFGNNPVSGSTEPTWPTETGHRVTESVQTGPSAPTVLPPGGPEGGFETQPVIRGILDRYPGIGTLRE